MKKSALLVTLAGLWVCGSPGVVRGSDATATATNAITAVSPMNGGKNVPVQPALRWASTLDGVTAYQVEIATGASFSDKSVLGTVQAPTTTLTPEKRLSPGTNYFWRIGVFTTAGPNRIQYYSKPYSFMTIPKVSVNVVGNGKVSTLPAGIACDASAPCSATFPLSSNVTLKATGSATSTITISCTTTTAVTGKGTVQKHLTMTSNKACTVTFTDG